MITAKRSRGRPRKPQPFDWLRDPPEAAQRVLVPNLDEESDREFKILRDRDNRERASEAMIDNYSSRGRISNSDRRGKKRRLVDYIGEKYEGLIFRSPLSMPAIARSIVMKEEDFPYQIDTIRKYISSIKKSGKAK